MPSTENMNTNINMSYDNIPIFTLDNDVRVFINNDMLKELAKHTSFPGWDTNPMGLCDTNNFKDVNAFHYYKDAKNFSESVYPYLKNIDIKEDTDSSGRIKYGDVTSVFFNNSYQIYPSEREGDQYNSAHVKVGYSELTQAHPFDYKDTNVENDPEEEVSIFNNHRIDVIISSVEASLVSAIGNFNNYVSNTYSYAMPTLSENDWYKIANNLTTVSFMQGLPVGRYKFYSNYAVVTNKKNKEFIGRDAIYVQDIATSDYEQNYITKSAPQYHSPSCEDYNSQSHPTGVVGYRNIDYEEEPVLNTYPVVENGVIQIQDNGSRQEITQSLNYYFQPGTGAYECIVSRNQNRISTDDLIGQKTEKMVRRGGEDTSTSLPISEVVQTAYISALAREKGASYKHHSGLNYHKYTIQNGVLGEITDKTFNHIDKNFTDENNLNLPVHENTGEVVEPTPPPSIVDIIWEPKASVIIEVDDEISVYDLVNTNRPGTIVIKSIDDQSVVENTIGPTLRGVSPGQSVVHYEMTIYENGTYVTHTGSTTIYVTQENENPATKLENEEIKIYEVLASEERDITSTRVTLLTNEAMNLRATKLDTRDRLAIASSDVNKIKISSWNSTTDTGTIRANAKTALPVTVTVFGNIPILGTNSPASAFFSCDIVEQSIDIGNILITAGETKRLGTDQGADIKIELAREESLRYELLDNNDGAVTLDSSTGNLTANKLGSAVLLITGETSGATRQVNITVTDDRAIYYATLHTDGTLAFANTENASKVSGKVANKTYKVTLGNEQKFVTEQTEINGIAEIRFVEPITVRGTKIEWFREIPNLKRIVNENNLNTENITDMRRMFYNTSKLEGSLDLNNWNTSRVENMSQMFDGCASIRGIVLDRWNTQNVRDMSNMFIGCSSLESITANATTSAWNVNHVLNMAYMFQNCTSLRTANLNNWDAGNVSNMQSMFKDCSSLQSINISTWNTQSLMTTNTMFENCTELKTVIADSSAGNWTTAKVSDISYMFSNCNNITNISLQNWDTTNVVKMQSMFLECTSVQNIDLHTWITTATTPNGHDKNHELMFNNCSSLRRLNLNEWTLGANANSMFNNCKALETNGFIISRVKTTATTNMIGMFSNCESLTSLNLATNGDYWNVANITSTLNMFNGCIGLRSINVSNWDVRNVARLDNMFYKCESLQGINLSSWNTNWNNDNIRMDSMFAFCSSLNSLNLQRLVNQKVTKINNMFEKCSSLSYFSWNSWNWDVSKVNDMTSFFFGAGLNSVDLDLSRAGGETIVTNLRNFYASCRKLSTVSMTNWKAPNLTSITELYRIEDTSGIDITNSDSLQTVIMSGWNAPKITTLNGILSNKTKLLTVDFSNWAGTNLRSLRSMFANCVLLQTANFANVDTINVYDMKNMFYGCERLLSVNFNALNTSNVSMSNLEGMFFGCSGGYTIIINSAEKDLESATRAKLVRAYNDSAETYYRYYASSNRYKIFGHTTDRYWEPPTNKYGGYYVYYWSGSVNFVVM